MRSIDLVGEILDIASSLPKRERVGNDLGLLPYQFPKRKPLLNSTDSFHPENLGTAR